MLSEQVAAGSEVYKFEMKKLFRCGVKMEFTCCRRDIPGYISCYMHLTSESQTVSRQVALWVTKVSSFYQEKEILAKKKTIFVFMCGCVCRDVVVELPFVLMHPKPTDQPSSQPQSSRIHTNTHTHFCALLFQGPSLILCYILSLSLTITIADKCLLQLVICQ